MTNSERRVTLCTAFQEPEWEAKEDWRIFAEVGRRLGFTDKFSFETSADVYREFVELTRDRPCDMTGMSHEKLQKEGPLQWPFPEKKEGEEREEGLNNASQRLYTDGKFNTPDGKARFSAYHSRGLAEPPDRDYPFVLTTGRLYGHWHTLTRTGRIEKIKQMHPDPFIEIHPKDAKQLNIQEGDLVKVCSRRGETIFPAKVTSAIVPGTVFVPMHWGSLWAENSEANALTHPEACPDSKQPELKACAVKLMKL
jgi:ferredoxin-nitrate reductase